MIDGRTKEGHEAAVLAELNDGDFVTSIFWATAHMHRGAALDRLLKRGIITADNSRGYPTIIFRLKEE